jgi:amidohydrolase
LWSPGDLGSILCSNGPVMAASDHFTIDVEGQGGHGAMPAGTVDAIVEAAYLVSSLHTIVPRNLDPFETGVLTCGTINGGYGYNIIADKVTITGTCRSFNKEAQELIKSRMQCVCCGIAQAFGGKISMNYEYGYPPTVNSYPECVDIVAKSASKVVGKERATLLQRTMGAEDFSYFLQERPGCFFFVGGDSIIARMILVSCH